MQPSEQQRESVVYTGYEHNPTQPRVRRTDVGRSTRSTRSGAGNDDDGARPWP